MKSPRPGPGLSGTCLGVLPEGGQYCSERITLSSAAPPDREGHFTKRSVVARQPGGASVATISRNLEAEAWSTFESDLLTGRGSLYRYTLTCRSGDRREVETKLDELVALVARYHSEVDLWAVPDTSERKRFHV